VNSSGQDFNPPLTPELLRAAYSHGYFPMPHPETDEILWFNPDPRAILPLDHFHASHSLKKRFRRGEFTFTKDQAFESILEGCADRDDTWINDEIKEAYTELYHQGTAHSVEVWKKGVLVGGLYGVAIGGAFFAESMFHIATDASKAALWHLVGHLDSRGFKLLEVQFLTPHLKSLGAVEIPASTYEPLLHEAIKVPTSFL